MPIPYGVWLATRTPVSDPYPCRCHTARDGCRAGGRRKCPCWGRTDVEHLPVGCCGRRCQSVPRVPEDAGNLENP